MTDEIEEEIERTPAEDSPWGKFLIKTIELDNDPSNIKAHGTNWFSALCALRNQGILPHFDIGDIQEILHDTHIYKSGGVNMSPHLQIPIQDLIHNLGNPTKIELIDFSKLFFDTPVNFLHFIFPINVSFEHTQFDSVTAFNKAAFYRNANFNNTLFNGNVDFSRASFCGETDFLDVKFKNSANFIKTTFFEVIGFSRNPDFTNATFSDVANFIEATFFSIALFQNVKFSSEAYFSDITFSKVVEFKDAKFSKKTDFYNTKFLGGVNFNKAEFSDSVSFEDVKINAILMFMETTFHADAKFDKVDITGHTKFTNAKFKKFAPHFHKAELYSDTIWDDVKWPKLSKKSNRDIVSRNKSAYENLVSQMRKHNKYYDEHSFFRHEMQCRRWLEKNPFIRFPYWLYEKISDYGYGVGRAFIVWLLHIIAGTVALFLHHFCTPVGTFFDDLTCSAGISFANAHSFLFFHNGPLKGCYEHLDKFYFYNTIWGIQTILGVLFLFLLLLTLRTRFRLR